MPALKDFNYSIATSHGTYPVVGRRYGRCKVLAVRRVELVEPMFVVDRIPTGRMIAELDDQRAAVHFAKALDGLLGKKLKSSDHEQVLDSMPVAVRDWIRRVKANGYEPFEAHPVVNSGQEVV